MWLLPISMLVVTVLLAIPLSRYMSWIMDGKYRVPKALRWFEDRLNSGPQSWKQYTLSLLIFNTVLFVFGFIVSGGSAVDASQPATQGNALADNDLSHSCLLHDQYGRAALFGRRAFL